MYQSIFKLPRKACHIHHGRSLHTLTHLPAQVSQAGMIDSQFSGNVHKVIPVLSSQLWQADLFQEGIRLPANHPALRPGHNRNAYSKRFASNPNSRSGVPDSR
jgi:hypothetical protein